MRFLNPGMLNFLWAALIPLVIHLISRGRTRKIQFSTVRFIRELEHDTIRRFRIRQWLLTFIRMLVIALLVLVFARPVSQGFVPDWLAQADVLGVVIIDNSASMAVETESKTRLERHKVSAVKVLNALDSEIDIAIYRTNPPKLVYEGKNYESQFRKGISNIAQSHGSDHLWENLESFVTAEIEKNTTGIECFVFSDFQTFPEQHTRYFSETGNPDSTRWRFYFFPSPPVLTNNSIRDAFPESRIHRANHPFRLNTRIVNDGVSASKQIPVQMFVNDERVGQVVTTLESGKSKDFLFQAYPGIEDVIRGEIRLPDDDFNLDNSYTFDIPLTSRISCKLVAGSPEDILLPELALRSIDEENELLHLDTQVLSNIDRLFLDDYDVLILHNPGEMSKKAVGDVQSFLRKGGGVIWFAGEGQARISAQKGDLALNLPVYLGDSGIPDGSYYTLSLNEEDHSLISELDLRDLSSELPVVNRYIDSGIKPDHNVILSMNNDRPFLVECPSNTGKIMYFTSIVDMNWNNLALRGLFIPLLHRLIQYLATDEKNTNPVYTEQKKIIQIEKELLKSEWTLVDPAGNSYTLIPDYNREMLSVKQTGKLGRNLLLADGLPYTSFSTHLPPNEFPTGKINIEEFPGLRNYTNLRLIDVGGDLSMKMSEIRLGKALWRSFLVLIILLLAVEMVFSMVKKDQLKDEVRQGVD